MQAAVPGSTKCALHSSCHQALILTWSRIAYPLPYGALLLRRWLYAVADDFFTKQLPHNVTWGLTVLYALDAPGDFSDTAVQARPAQGLVLQCVSCSPGSSSCEFLYALPAHLEASTG